MASPNCTNNSTSVSSYLCLRVKNKPLVSTDLSSSWKFSSENTNINKQYDDFTCNAQTEAIRLVISTVGSKTKKQTATGW